jgi:hypothetical protein
MNPVAVTLKRTRGGWAIGLTDGREIARFTGPGAKYRALRYLASHDIARGVSRRR